MPVLLEQDWEVKIKNTDIVPKTMTHQATERRIQVVYNVGLTEAPGLLEPVETSTKLIFIYCSWSQQ